MRHLVAAIAMLWAALNSGAAGTGANAAHAGSATASYLMSRSFTNTDYVSPWDGRRIPQAAMARVW